MSGLLCCVQLVIYVTLYFSKTTTITKTSLLMVFLKIFHIYSDNPIKHIKTLRGKKCGGF
jgi:hypothetical protein